MQLMGPFTHAPGRCPQSVTRNSGTAEVWAYPQLVIKTGINATA